MNKELVIRKCKKCGATAIMLEDCKCNCITCCEEKMETLTSELGDLFKESKELESKIRQSLKDIGFEF